jgi:site-specific DNA recombinase
VIATKSSVEFIEALAELMHARGLLNRSRSDYDSMPVTVNGMTWILTNRFYAGYITSDGVEYRGLHEPLVDEDTLAKVQSIFAARDGRSVRDRRHRHYLKGIVHCGVCGRGLSLQLSKGGRYRYFFCLGQKDRQYPTGCQERYVPADKLEAAVEALYQDVQLPAAWADRLREDFQSSLIARQEQNSAERELLTHRLAKLETERRKLLDAYYRGAIDVDLLREEQARIGEEVREAEERLRDADADLAEWTGILEIALRFASNCSAIYRAANERDRHSLNSAVFERIEVAGGAISNVHYHPPFDQLLGLREFEYESMERETGFEPATSTLARLRSTE